MLDSAVETGLLTDVEASRRKYCRRKARLSLRRLPTAAMSFMKTLCAVAYSCWVGRCPGQLPLRRAS